MNQRIRQAWLRDGTPVSFATAGSGPALVYPPGWVSHLQLDWAMPAQRRFFESLARDRTLIRYDRPGCGLSEAVPRDGFLDLELEVLATVAEAAGAERFDLLGMSLSAPVAVAWCAWHPDSVARLLLYGGWVRGHDIARPRIREHLLGLVGEHWGLGSTVLTDIFAPDADAGLRGYFSEYQRQCASAARARTLLAACYEIDVGADLVHVRAPTTVLHRREDRAVPVTEGERLATGIPDADFHVLTGRSHIPFVGDVDGLVDAVRSGLGLPRVGRRPAPVLTDRQREVADLVARGMSNREIAGQLVISERSVESHIERILIRLNLHTRTQVAAWWLTGRSSTVG